MMVRAYLEWSIGASASERAEAVGILADVFLDGELCESSRRDAESALLLALDDPSPLVRLMLARKLGAAERAPRALIAALSQDAPEIATIVVANSPFMADAALVDLLALGDASLQRAVAGRMEVSAPVAAAICEVGEIEAASVLLTNDGASIPIFALRRLIARFPSDALLRETLLERGDLPADIRIVLVKRAAEQLALLAEERGWLPAVRAARLAQDCAESGAVAIAAGVAPDEIGDLVQSLKDAGALTPQLLLRSLLSGETRLLAAALAALASVAPSKASGLVHGRSAAGFKALYRKAGLPQRFETAFEAALAAWNEKAHADVAPGALSRRMVERVLTAVAALGDRELDRLTALLIRYQAEAARAEARAAVAEILSEPAPSVELTVEDLEARLQDAILLEFKAAA